MKVIDIQPGTGKGIRIENGKESKIVDVSNEIDKQVLLEAGGKLWEKGDMKRIYLNAQACIALFKRAGYKTKLNKMEEKSLKKAKTFWDLNTEELRSDVGTVRVMFNRKGFDCGK